MKREFNSILFESLYKGLYWNCCCSVTQSCLTLCNPMDCSMAGLSVLYHLPDFAQVHVHCMGDAIQPFHSLIPSSSASIFPSIRDFSNELAVRIKWPKYWSFCFSISPSNEYSQLISLMIDWFDLPIAQGTIRSLLQHHNSKASILWQSAFFTVQLSQLYMTLGRP